MAAPPRETTDSSASTEPEAETSEAPDSRAAVLDAHLAKQRQIANDREAEARARARLERLRSQAAQLEALIDGSLDVAVDPASLLRIDLSEAHELGDEQRLARLLGSEATDGEPNPAAAPDTAPAWAPSDDLAKALAEAEAALDSQRMRFLASTRSSARPCWRPTKSASGRPRISSRSSS